MKPNRIALALVLAGLAAPAFAEKCVGSCDFNDEPLVVKGDKKQTGAEQPAASNGLATPMKSSVPMLTPLDAPARLAAAPAKPTPALISTEWVFVATVLDQQKKPSGPTVSEIVMMKSVDSASPQLMLSSAQGMPLPSPALTPGKIETRIAPAAPPQAGHVKVFDGSMTSLPSANHTRIEQVAPALKGAATVGPATRR